MQEKNAEPIVYSVEPGIDLASALGATQFQNLMGSMDRDNFRIKSIHFQSVDVFGGRVAFLKFKANVTDRDGLVSLPGIVFMRGGSVAILPIFRCDGRYYTVLTVQPRFSTGCFNFKEIPAGMLDGSGNFAGKAADEMKEELGLNISDQDLIDLSELAGHEHGFYPSPGGCDETIRLFCYFCDIRRQELEDMEGRCTGLRQEGELIKLAVVPLEDLLQVPDGKSLSAYCLFKHHQQRIEAIARAKMIAKVEPLRTVPQF